MFQFCLIWWLIKNRKTYDIIHACDFDTVIPAWFLAKFFRKMYVYDIFDYYVDAFHVPKKLKKLVEGIDLVMINHANAVIIANESRRRQIAKSNPRQLYVIHNSPDIQINWSDDTKSTKPKNPKFVYVGVLGGGRMLKEIIDVFIKQRSWELHIGGFGPLENYIKEASNVYENIVFYGKLPYHEVLELERRCDILFAIYDPKIKNHKFSSPNKLYEAMALGKPIIVAKGTGIDEVVLKENIGKAIDFTPEAFIEASNEILNEDFSELAILSKKIYLENYSWSIMELRLKKIYEKSIL